jgi:SNF2 family DNA or RNA helicase
MDYFSVCLNVEDYLRKRIELGPQVYIVLLLNKEAMNPIRDILFKLHWDIVVWDEAQDIKDRTSRASKDAMMLARRIDFRLALTGTPMDLSERDLWAMMRFVNPDVFGDVWKDFELEYIEQVSDKFREKIQKTRNPILRQRLILAMQIAQRKAPLHKKGKKKFAKRISKWVMRISKEDAGIQGARINTLLFNLKGKQEKKYQRLEKHMVVKVNGEVVKAPLKIVQMGKLQQMTGGYLKDEDGRVHVVGRAKRNLLESAIEQYAPDEPFVIFCKFVWEVHALARLLHSMGFNKVAKLWGKVKDIKTDPRRTQMLLDFQTGKFDVMVCQQKTGGVGVDLFRARKAFVYSFGHSFIDWDQMLARLDFLEQNDAADFFLLLARNTIDIDLYQSVKEKKSITEVFYNRLRERQFKTRRP